MTTVKAASLTGKYRQREVVLRRFYGRQILASVQPEEGRGDRLIEPDVLVGGQFDQSHSQNLGKLIICMVSY